MCVKKYVYLFFSTLFFTTPMSLLDVTSDGINSWDQMGYNASGTLIFVWLDPLMHSFCDNFDTKENKTANENVNNFYSGSEKGISYNIDKVRNENDNVKSGCENYYKRLKQRYLRWPLINI